MLFSSAVRPMIVTDNDEFGTMTMISKTDIEFFDVGESEVAGGQVR